MVHETIAARLNKLCDELNQADAAKHAAEGFTYAKQHGWHWKDGQRWVKIDCGPSGAFLMDAGDGELYNIKAYGVPDHNKKRKADIGSIYSTNGYDLIHKRWNYLR